MAATIVAACAVARGVGDGPPGASAVLTRAHVEHSAGGQEYALPVGWMKAPLRRARAG